MNQSACKPIMQLLQKHSCHISSSQNDPFSKEAFRLFTLLQLKSYTSEFFKYSRATMIVFCAQYLSVNISGLPAYKICIKSFVSLQKLRNFSP